MWWRFHSLRFSSIIPLLFATISSEAPATVDCAVYANGDAHKWAADFKSINIKPWSKELFTDFYAAPLHYCFEAYELRLHHHNSAQINHSAIVPTENLYWDKFGNVTVRVGNFTFENVSMGTYDIFLIPLERSTKYTEKDGSHRCLCPIEITKAVSHSKIVCSCTEAKWDNVEMHNPYPTAPPTQPPSFPACDPGVNPDRRLASGPDPGPGLVLLGSIGLFGFLALLLVNLAILLVFLRHYRRTSPPTYVPTLSFAENQSRKWPLLPPDNPAL